MNINKTIIKEDNQDEMQDLVMLANPLKKKNDPSMNINEEDDDDIQEDDCSELTNDDDEDEDEDEDNNNNADEEDQMTAVASVLSNENEKLDLLVKLNLLRDNGHVVKKLDIHNKITDIKLEYFRITRHLELKSSIKFQQQMLLAAVSAIEFLNKRFDPFDVYLEGWSENVMENIDNFNNIFEKLYDKYRKKREMAPELELLIALAGSAFMFNLTNTIFKKSIGRDNIRKCQNIIRESINKNKSVRTNNDDDEEEEEDEEDDSSSSSSTNDDIGGGGGLGLPFNLSGIFNGLRNITSGPPPPPPPPLPRVQQRPPVLPTPIQRSLDPVLQNQQNEQLRRHVVEQQRVKDENDNNNNSTVIDDSDRFSIASSTTSEKNVLTPSNKGATSQRGGGGRRGGRRGGGRGGRGGGGGRQNNNNESTSMSNNKDALTITL